jgi:hypothetical protein
MRAARPEQQRVRPSEPPEPPEMPDLSGAAAFTFDASGPVDVSDLVVPGDGPAEEILDLNGLL